MTKRAKVKAWTNNRERRAYRNKQRADGTYVAPTPPKKTRKPVSPTGRVKPKRAKTKNLEQPLGGRSSFPEFAVIERRPYHAPNRYPFTGGTVVSHLSIPKGFVLATDPHPGPEYRASHLKVLRTSPEGETVRLVKWTVRDSVHTEMARRAAAVLAEIREADNQAANKRDLQLLVNKNRRNALVNSALRERHETRI
jgi:hypothetical protein